MPQTLAWVDRGAFAERPPLSVYPLPTASAYQEPTLTSLTLPKAVKRNTKYVLPLFHALASH